MYISTENGCNVSIYMTVLLRGNIRRRYIICLQHTKTTDENVDGQYSIL